jgi:hypothetical protein
LVLIRSLNQSYGIRIYWITWMLTSFINLEGREIYPPLF